MRLAPAMPLLLAACLPAPDAPATCDAARLDSAVGLPLAEIAVEPARTTRVIRPGEAWTEDYGPERLNIMLDQSDRAIRFWCG